MTHRVVVADDHPIFRRGWFDILEEYDPGMLVDHAHDGPGVVRLAKLFHPHLIFMDIEMPRMNGLEAARQIIKETPEMKVVMLTMHNSRATFDVAMDIGVSGYVLKENAVQEIKQCLDEVLNDRIYLSPELRAQLEGGAQESTSGWYSLLTQSEKKILQLISEFKTSRSIAEELHVSEKTVSNHRINMARKLGIKGSHTLLRFALENHEILRI